MGIDKDMVRGGLPAKYPFYGEPDLVGGSTNFWEDGEWRCFPGWLGCKKRWDVAGIERAVAVESLGSLGYCTE